MELSGGLVVYPVVLMAVALSAVLIAVARFAYAFYVTKLDKSGRKE